MANDPDEAHRRFLGACHAQFEDGTARAAARFEPKGVPVHIRGGHGDSPSIEEILDEAPWVVNAREKVIEITPGSR